jgi:hypothetical protein
MSEANCTEFIFHAAQLAALITFFVCYEFIRVACAPRTIKRSCVNGALCSDGDFRAQCARYGDELYMPT